MRPRVRSCLAALLVVLPLAPATGFPQFGESVEAGGVEFLRDTDDAHLYHALPSSPRLATDAGGRPRFSLMEFSYRGAEGDSTPGALLHFMLTWGLDADEQARVERALRRRDPEARISSALLVREGRYRVVAGVADGEREPWVLAEGRAPVLPGQPIAFSKRLDADETDRLKAVLASEDGAVAAGFLLGIEAMGPAIVARVTIDWDAVWRSEHLAAARSEEGASEAALREAFDALVRGGAINIERDPSPSALAAIYSRFRMQACEAVVGVSAAPGAARPGLERRYVLREDRRSGRVELLFDGRSVERRELLITGDITEAIRGVGILSASPASAESSP